VCHRAEQGADEPGPILRATAPLDHAQKRVAVLLHDLGVRHHPGTGDSAPPSWVNIAAMSEVTIISHGRRSPPKRPQAAHPASAAWCHAVTQGSAATKDDEATLHIMGRDHWAGLHEVKHCCLVVDTALVPVQNRHMERLDGRLSSVRHLQRGRAIRARRRRIRTNQRAQDRSVCVHRGDHQHCDIG
jgi:hypothetical protein